MKNIRITYGFVLIIILAFLIGLTKEILLIFSAFIIHEIGHLVFFKVYEFKVNKITIFPFGGVIDYDLKNDFLYKEILVTVAGVLFNYLFYLIFSLLRFNALAHYNYFLILINLLPIYPLDGGRVMIYLLSYLIPYRLAKKLGHIFSIFLSLLLLTLFVLEYSGFLLILICLIFIRNNITSLIILKREYERFILIKYLYPNSAFKEKMTKYWIDKPIHSLFYDRYMIFKYDEFLVKEEVVLNKYYKQKEESL